MDAKARRFLWNDILSLIKENRIVILTSHSMEECEALCTRLVIMVNGEFKCLGSPQHLKTKFGNGYKLTIRLNNEANEGLFDFMKLNFSNSIHTETHKNLYDFILPFNSTKLSQIFGTIEKNRESLNIKDYSITQTTLDQIFVNFAKSQKDSAFKDDDEDDDESEESSELPFASVKNPVPSINLNNQITRQTSSPVLLQNNLENINSESRNKPSTTNQINNDSLGHLNLAYSAENLKVDEENSNEINEKIYDSNYYEDFFPKPLNFDSNKEENIVSTSF